MKILLLTIFCILSTSLSAHALVAESISEWMASDLAYTYRAPSVLSSLDTRSFYTNLAASESKAVFSSQAATFLQDTVMIARPSVASANVPFVTKAVAGATGKVILRKALAFAGPIATGVTIAMTLNDMYNEAQTNPSIFPQLHALSNPAIMPPSEYMGAPVVGSQRTIGGKPYTVNSAVQIYPAGTYWNYYYSQTHWIVGDANAGGTLEYGASPTEPFSAQYPGWSPVYRVTVSPVALSSLPTSVATPEQFEAGLVDPYLESIKPTYLTEVDNVMKTNVVPTATSSVPKALMSPTTSQIKDVATRVDTADKAAASTNTAQINYNLAPTAVNAQTLADAQARQALVEQTNATKEDVLTPPPLPTNAYDSTIVPPDKKSIPTLLADFVKSAPLVTMVRTFVITSSGEGFVDVGNVYGQNMIFDFRRYETLFRTTGGILLVIMHGFAIFVVVRGW